MLLGLGVVALKREDDDAELMLPLVEVDLKDVDEGSGAKWYQILLEGVWKGYRGRSIAFTRADLDAIVAAFRDERQDVVVDYEHATRLAGAEAPAAGWIVVPDGLEVRDVDGKAALFAKVRWNRRAREYISGGEYRRLSPVVIWGSQHPVTGKRRSAWLHSLALTNRPFLQELPEVRLSRTSADDTDQKEQEAMEEHLKEIAAKLGLAADAKPEAVIAAVGELVARDAGRAASLKAIYGRLDLDEGESAQAAVAKIAALKAPAGMVSADRVEAIEAQLREQKAERLVEAALRDGKISAAEEVVAEFKALAEKDPEAFERLVAKMPRTVPTRAKQPADGGATGGDGAELTRRDREVAVQLGVSDDDIRKYNTRQYVGRAFDDDEEG